MAHFEIELVSPLSPEQTLRAVLNPVAQTSLIPFTTVRRDGDYLRTRTGGKLIGFDGDMLIRYAADDPCSVSIQKLSNVITGQVQISAVAAPQGSTLHWRQEINVRFVPSFADPLVSVVAKFGYRRILHKLLKWPAGK